MTTLFDFAVATIFAREFLEGAIIIGEYRTIILRGEQALAPGLRKEDGLRAITNASILATMFALVVIAAIAIPLAILSSTFDNTTSNIIEGVSKIVAAISLLQLSLKLPKFLGVYGSKKKAHQNQDGELQQQESGLTLRSIRFNVAWNIWREVAECGVFLIPFFLSGENLESIPLSALIGAFIGLAMGLGIYVANKRLKNKTGLAIFAVSLLVFLAAGLFTGGCHKLELELGSTKTVWEIEGDFWSVDRLPMTVMKPFGWNDSRTVLEIVCYWSWLLASALLHYRKYRICSRIDADNQKQEKGAEQDGAPGTRETSLSRQDAEDSVEDVEMGLAQGQSAFLSTEDLCDADER